ncbi:MAG: hypothetical protein A2X31_00525 [Elusimicrobia bacterium GWB2_63_22]|nr:MAG: hypothetical protein A2X31_00525 [Elusimicrobia bacterium GWB2_63_22]
MENKSAAVLAFFCASALFAAGGPALCSRPSDLRDAPRDSGWASGMDAVSVDVPAVPAAAEAVAERGSSEGLEFSRALRARWNVEQAERLLRTVGEQHLRALGQDLGPAEEDFARKKLAAVRDLLTHAKAHALTGADRSAAQIYMEPGFAATLYPEQEKGTEEFSRAANTRNYNKSLALDGPDDSRFAPRGFTGGDMARIRGLVDAARAKRDSAGHVHGWQGNARQAFNPFLRRIGADREIPDSGCSSWAFASVEALRADKTLAAKYDTAAMYGWKLLPHFVALVWPRGTDPLRTAIYVDAWAGKTEIATLGEWRRFYSFINVVQPDGMRECDLDDWHGDFNSAKCW